MKTLRSLANDLLSATSFLVRRVAIPLLFLIAGLALVRPCAAAPDAFSNTGSLTTARYFHTATPLTNGKVLVAGGKDNSQVSRSAELYDPATGLFAATGNLNLARQSYTATLLPNGKVLVVGGYAGGVTTLASAELYDPASGLWTETGSLTAARHDHIATLLSNGKVLVAGGTTGFGGLASAELYDPASGTWADTGSLKTARYDQTATLLSNGKVLVAGGADSTNKATASAELYDPASGSWSATGNLKAARFAHTGTLLLNGKVLVAGGTNAANTATTSAELYDPASGTWTATGGLNTARFVHTATLLTNGKVLVAGGGDTTNKATASAELYDPASASWTATGSLNVARYFHTAALLSNGMVLVAGGLDGSNKPTASAELYDGPPTPSGVAEQISTRLSAGIGDNTLTLGFIVQGNVPKKVLIRGIGTSLQPFFGDKALADPTLTLKLQSTGEVLGMNDNWKTTQIGGVITSDQSAAIQASGSAPAADEESAIIATLPAGNYTAEVKGVNGGTGFALAEVFDAEITSAARLANLSTRGLVEVDDNIMITGLIVQANTKVVVRALGPSLTAFGVQGALQDPTLELKDANGTLITTNDNWQDASNANDIPPNLKPSNSAESVILTTLPTAGRYTVQLRGKDLSTGVAIIEGYFLQ